MSLIDNERLKLLSLRKTIAPELERLEGVFDAFLEGETPLLRDICAHIRRGKGKLFRPTLLLLAAKHDGGTVAEAVTAAACVELVHTATLVHDDFIDASATRRGQPSVNGRWGDAAALIMGDYLYAKALDALSAAGLHDAVNRLARTTVLMSQAEMLQLETRYDLGIDEATYLRVIHWKTAALIESACAIGAGFNPAVAGRAEAFAEFGRKVGFVFQITDDIFDYLGDSRRLGKPTGQDWEEGRVTLPLIAALAGAGEGERDAFLKRYADLPDDDRRASWPGVKEFVLGNGGVEYARAMARRHGDEAKAAVADVAVGAQRELLDVAVDYVIKRLN